MRKHLLISNMQKYLIRLSKNRSENDFSRNKSQYEATTMSVPNLQLALIEEDLKLQETREKLVIAEADMTQQQQETGQAQDHHDALCAQVEPTQSYINFFQENWL